MYRGIYIRFWRWEIGICFEPKEILFLFEKRTWLGFGFWIGDRRLWW